jgi:hypothetical protein
VTSTLLSVLSKGYVGQLDRQADLVERFDGRIEVESNEGQGTTFIVPPPLASTG